jgi:hypothetical protein
MGPSTELFVGTFSGGLSKTALYLDIRCIVRPSSPQALSDEHVCAAQNTTNTMKEARAIIINVSRKRHPGQQKMIITRRSFGRVSLSCGVVFPCESCHNDQVGFAWLFVACPWHSF